MTGDDDVLESYEQEFASGEPPRPRTNRGFWIVVATLVTASVILVGEILVNLPVKDTFAHAQHSLRVAEAAAGSIHEATGSYSDADPAGLAGTDPSIAYVDAGVASAGLDEVSVAAFSPDEWAAAVQVRSDACFYLRILADEVYYGVGTECTGRAALEASDPRW